MYDVAILINLDRREDRRDWILNHFEKRGLKNVVVYPAFDGQEIKNMIVNPPRRNYFSWVTMNPNVVACGLSHIGALKMAKALGHKRVLMLEDDAVMSKDIVQRLELLEKETENLDWQHIFVGGAVRGRDKMKQVTDHLWTSNFTDGTHAYLVQNEGIDIVADEMLHFNTTLDDAVNDLILSNRIKSFTMLPLGSYQKADHSDIDNRFIARNDTMTYYKETL
jgi:hypothetical protein